eukprot:TRINITY_DN36214_c0_g1_i1.p2 TRINITY_DN36214_c0_g1~~TRINITY_DN36214_c0_g1_i1.p2  ORF type:complete len:118 (-),score=2.56 TRINITY_DN36214_c0_g1_i1:206-559(-)
MLSPPLCSSLTSTGYASGQEASAASSRRGFPVCPQSDDRGPTDERCTNRSIDMAVSAGDFAAISISADKEAAAADEMSMSLARAFQVSNAAEGSFGEGLAVSGVSYALHFFGVSRCA